MTSDQREQQATTQTSVWGDVTFTEQLAHQLGGWRGLVESGIPVLVFVILNLVTALRPAIIGAVGVAVAMAVWRLIRRKPIRHAVNGLFGIGIGAYLAWRSGNAGAFYLPGILINLAWGVGMAVSVAVGHPAMGWLYSVVAAKGSTTWRRNARLVRTLNWLTMLGALIFLSKAALQYVLYKTDHDTVLGISRIALGYPSYAFLLALTIWSVRRAGHVEPA
jgi:hypothetical protein